MWVNPSVGRITSGYGMRKHPITGVVRLHSGTDIDGNIGDPIWAASDGTVTFSGFDTVGTRGNMVHIAHAGGVVTWYLHMTALHVAVGATVVAGQQIGTVGKTGEVTGAHLHFETRVNGSPQNPVPFMSARGVTLGSGTPTHPTPTPDPEPVPEVQEDEMVVILNKSNNSAIVVSGGKAAPVIGWDNYVTLSQTLPSLGVSNEQFNAFAAAFA